MNFKDRSNSKIEDEAAFYIERLEKKELDANVLGYYVESTAKYDVDDPVKFTPSNKLDIKQLATELFEQNNPQLVIYIHGYSVKPDRAKNRSQEIYDAANNFQSNNSVFIGYRWPAENRREKEDFPFVDRNKLKGAFTSLPTLLLALLMTAIIISLTSLSLTFLSLTSFPLFRGETLITELIVTGLITSILSITLSLIFRRWGKANKNLRFFPHLLILAFIATIISVIFGLISKELNFNWSLGFILIPLVISIVVFSIVVALILLRLSTYPRDRYRASNYGVVDLIELLRNLDKEVFQLACKKGAGQFC